MLGQLNPGQILFVSAAYLTLLSLIPIIQRRKFKR